MERHSKGIVYLYIMYIWPFSMFGLTVISRDDTYGSIFLSKAFAEKRGTTSFPRRRVAHHFPGDTPTEEKTERLIDRQTHRYTDRGTDIRTGRWTD